VIEMADDARTVILVPRRADGGPRDRIWAWCRARWERLHPELPIVEGHHTVGPFSRSAAINEAARLAGDWDHAVVVDADVFLPPAQVREAIERATTTGRVTWAFQRWRGLSRAATERLLRPDPAHERGLFGPDGLPGWDGTGLGIEALVERTNPVSWSCCFVVPRTVWDAVGGFDERFRGWGWEDMAFRSVVTTLHGHERIDGDLYHWWHPRSVEREPARSEHRPEYEANQALGRRYMAAAEAGDVGTLEGLVAGARATRAGITVLVLTNGRREYLERCIASLEAMVSGPVIRRRIWDDSGDVTFRAWLRETYPAYHVMPTRVRNAGYTEAMGGIWRYVAARPGGYAFLVEEDFTFERPVDLAQLAAVLDADRNLTQVALLRQPCYPREIEAGGIVEEAPDDFTTRRLDGLAWLEHRRFFTTNPTLFRRSLCEVPWPSGAHSEARFGERLNEDPDNRFALFGDGTPWVRHIGDRRTGRGY
jgi:hypothetical protein